MALTAPLASNPSQDRGPTVIGFFVGFTVVAIVFVGLRLGIRIHRKLLGWDDLTISIAMVASILQTVFASVAVHHGYGKHIGDIPKAELKKALFWFYICQVCYKCVTWPTKASILLMYQRVFGDTPGVRAYGVRFRYLLIFMMVVVVGSFFSTSFVGIFACNPVYGSWDKSVKPTCVKTIPWWFSYAAINISTDIAILALPIPLINGLMQITRRQKLVLMGVFLLGAFVCIVTIIRMTTLKTGAAAQDPTYNGVDTLQWTGVETNVGIICACLPLLRPLLNKFIPWFAQRTHRGATHSRPTYNVYGYGGNGSGPRNHTNPEAKDGSWGKWGNGQNVVMSNISTRRPESRTSSEAGITEGITRKVDFQTMIETASYKGSEERQYSQDEIGHAV